MQIDLPELLPERIERLIDLGRYPSVPALVEAALIAFADRRRLIRDHLGEASGLTAQEIADKILDIETDIYVGDRIVIGNVVDGS